MSLIAELKQRKLVQWAVAYLAGAWVLLQVAGLIGGQFGWSPSLLRGITIAAGIGFLVALLLAWYHGERGAQKVSGTELLILTLLLAIGGGLLWEFAPGKKGKEVIKAPAIASVPVSAADTHSIAVLPFVDMSQAHDQEYFSDGLSEELLNLLAQLPQMRVIARTSSFSFKGKEVDVATIAKKLNVANVLEGSVRKSGNTLRITAQLIRASDSSHLWSQTYDRELTDVFKVQDDIAGAVVAALKVQLLPNQALTNRHASNNPEAYNQYLLGNQFYNRQNPEDWRRAIAAFRQAIAIDPQYAAAYAGLATAQGFLADNMGDRATMQESIASADKAIALAPGLADGYISRAISRLSHNKDWAGAQADLEKAMALNASDSRAQIGYGRLLIALGRVPEAIAVTRKAADLDPLSSVAWTQFGRMLNAVGKFPEARQALDRALEISPESNVSLFHRGMNDLLQGRAQESLAYFRKGGAGYGGAGVAMAEFSLGHAKESQQAVDQEIAQYAQGAAYQIAEVYAWRGEKDKAFEWLDRAYDQYDGGLTFIKADPLVKSLVSDPRYAALMKKMGLPL